MNPGDYLTVSIVGTLVVLFVWSVVDDARRRRRERERRKLGVGGRGVRR